MRYEVAKVLLNERVPGTESAPYAVTIVFFEKGPEFEPNGEVEVYVDRSIASLADVRQQAIEKAREFLTKALAALDQQP